VSTIKESPFPEGDEQEQDPLSPRGTHARDGKRRAVWKLFGITVLSLTLLVAACAGGVAWYLHDSLQAIDHNIERFAAPDQQIPEAERPSVIAPEATNILMLGSDSRISAGDPSQWTFGAQRTDAIMILHIPANRKGAYVVSIPRDSWVSIPDRKSKAKINAGFSYGGPTLMVRTVEQLTGVRIDHVVIIDFDGFVGLTDKLGGVDINVAGEGKKHMDGADALAYVRTRKTLANGDFDRVKRQQNWIRTVMAEMLSKDMAKSPKSLMDSLKMLSKSVATDDGLTIDDMRDLGWSMKSVRAKDVTFMTVPVAGTGRSSDGQSIVKLDLPQDKPLFEAIKKDKMADYLASHDLDVLGSSVR
jgi:LCP family protein required for cell wall assembly